MRKLFISSSIALALGLVGCGGGETLSEIQDKTETVTPYARIVYDPSGGELNIPNDLLMLPDTSTDTYLFDFTLNTEGDDTFDPADPQHALTGLDGWSTTHPFTIDITLPSGLDVDASSLGSGTIRIFEATQALEGSSATCTALASAIGAPGVPCEIGEELTYGVDFVTSYAQDGSGSINVIPLQPLKAAQGYMMVVTDALKDTEGRAVRGSTTWELVTQDPQTLPLSTESQLLLQNMVDVGLDLLAAYSIDRDSVSYTSYFTTQSVEDVLATQKKLAIAPYAQAFATVFASTGDLATAQATAAAYLPSVSVTESSAGDTPFDVLKSLVIDETSLAGLAALGLDTCEGLTNGLTSSNAQIQATAAATYAQVAPLCLSDLYSGTVDLPYYLSTTNPTGDWWTAACTSGAMIQAMGAESVSGLVSAGATGENNELCQAASSGQLFDLNLAAIGIDDPRFPTKYNPVLEAKGSNADGTETIPVQVTVPNVAAMTMLAAVNPAYSVPTQPATGWPVVILQHGITSNKESMLAISGALSLAGFATVAIDLPIHGERGFTINDTVVNATDGTGGSATDFLNLSSLLTARDNLRQSIVDIVNLRLALNSIDDGDLGLAINGTDVSFNGISLGSIAGIGAVGLANESLGDDLNSFDSMFAMQAASFSVPGGGIGNFLLESATFGPVIKGSLLAASSDDFVAALTQYMQANGIAEATTEVIASFYVSFYAQLDDATKAEVDATFASFGFASQTILDSGDPINLGAITAANTPVHISEVMDDAVIPNTTTFPLAGTEALVGVMGLEQVVSTTMAASGETVSGWVKMSEGSHSSLLSPSASSDATTEMQSQVATYLATKGQVIQVSNESVVAN